MSRLTSELFNRLQNLIEMPRDKREEVLASVLNTLSEERFTDIVNVKLAGVTPQAVRKHGMACFDRADTRPNPPDGYINIDEVAAFIGQSQNAEEQAVFLYIWLNFEQIKECSEDFEGPEKVFDCVLTRSDFENFSG